ncbi:hypothetical protein [Aneurinibacillus danicus]|jgi:hypothetical protein|uniref:Uncharacterized protein n=1 Tax=Aneurinibacillus danicus TaxID=267746 RepID=A0A511VD66_9BACL|nr:hypothetical protein [Aneurinibacillus danicus]GEN36837.1 hypothetical protein ADA01nite_42970 [Aneurinibacillus danicus]
MDKDEYFKQWQYEAFKRMIEVEIEKEKIEYVLGIMPLQYDFLLELLTEKKIERSN